MPQTENQFVFDAATNTLWLDIPKPILEMKFGNNSFAIATYQKEIEAWNSRLHYSCSPELKAKLVDGQVYEKGKDFQLITGTELWAKQGRPDMKGDWLTAIPLPDKNHDKELTEMCMTLTNAFDESQPLPDKGMVVNGHFTKEQIDYVSGIADSNLRSHLLHQVRLRDNMEADRNSFEKQLQKLKEDKPERLFTYGQMYEAVNRFYGSDYPMPDNTLKLFIKETFGIDIKNKEA